MEEMDIKIESVRHINAGEDDMNDIKHKVMCGEYKITTRPGRGAEYRGFGFIETASGDKVLGYLACRKCLNIYEHNSKTSSELANHKCPVFSKRNADNSLNANEIKFRLSSGEYKIIPKPGRSNVWHLFGWVETDSGEKLLNYVACRKCLNVYVFAENTSNLVKHKCYQLACKQNKWPFSNIVVEIAPEKKPAKKVDKSATKQAAINLFADIKCKVMSGEYKIIQALGRSRVWNLFGRIQNDSGEKVAGFVVCRKCLNVFTFKQCTSNLVRHKCYVVACKRNNWAFSKVVVDNFSKQKLKANDIKSKVISGEYKITPSLGHSKVWNLFGRIEIADTGEKVLGYVACRKCLNISMYDKQCTVKLLKHKCFTIDNSQNNSTVSETAVEYTNEENAVHLFTKWLVANCRPCEIVSDTGLKEIAEFFVSVGAELGSNIEVSSLIPNSAEISDNIQAMYETMYHQIKTEISTLADIGYGLTSHVWSDDLLRKSYFAVNIHFVKDGSVQCRLLGMKSMDSGRNTAKTIQEKVTTLLSEFGCALNDKAIMVIDRESSMASSFQSYNHIYCINGLLQNTLQKSIEEVEEISNMCKISKNILRYIKECGKNFDFMASSTFSSTRWNTFYDLFVFIKSKWNEITPILQENDELHQLGELNVTDLTCVIEVLELFESAIRKLEDEQLPTMHLVIVYIDKLLRKCAIEENDITIIKLFKEKIVFNLHNLVLENVNIFHKIALFLFPPANKLLQFNEIEKKTIRKAIMEIMSEFVEDQQSNSFDAEISQSNCDLFDGFISLQKSEKPLDMVSEELTMYENMIVHFHDQFDVLKWWDINKNQFPLLYKTSCRVLAIPASSVALDKVFCTARSLLTERQRSMGGSTMDVNKIMFLNYNSHFNHSFESDKTSI